HADWNAMASIGRYLQLAVERRELPGLKASFQGPKKTKAAKKTAKKPERRSAPKPKQRHRDIKNKGKRRAPSSSAGIPAGGRPPPGRPRRDGH
ncbi:MAG: ATP-dependent helicase, partial [Thiohalomonadaceae bacterium]